jgi:hypothetical protein
MQSQQQRAIEHEALARIGLYPVTLTELSDDLFELLPHGTVPDRGLSPRVE